MLQKKKLRKTYINVVNFIRMKFLGKPELNTQEKKIRDLVTKNKANKHYDKILKNIDTCENKLQVYTIKNMIEQFINNYGLTEQEKIVQLKDALDIKMEKLHMHL